MKLNELSEAVVAGLRSAQSFRANALLSLHEEFGVLGREGHRRVADAYGQSEMNGSAFLEELGLAGALRQSNFVYYVFAEVGKGIRHDLQKETLGVSELVRRLSLGFGSEVHASEFLFPNLLPFLADALLEPFERRDPDNPMQDAIKRFLLQQLGDIRLKPIRWNRVGAVAQSVMRRWLVETTLDGFFHLISDQVQRGESGADRQWRYRNAFWGAYLREGHITDAWVVLGWKLRQEAQSRLNLPRGSFANLESGESVRSDHAVLILRVANLVVTEWNHTAKVRVWHEGSESVPRFYKSSYYRSQMVSGADFEQRHHAAEYGTWQYQLERYIRGETGIRFSVRDLMPYD
ncbi:MULTISPECIES: EH signature domain-containing protein [unclassified Thioalkalivibrio]|uniref:EH signature domain-containing protein n=1 Tax=unclassified Thioalkalivibrio TaxID=2621013 RepID=UPI001E3D487A|nr:MULTISPECIES: EH signature domain-containing protein [unclassified Thioalkalivibrio]